MPAPEPISSSVFEYVDDMLDCVERRGADWREDLQNAAMTFCETFFEQFFGAVGLRFGGINLRAKGDAANAAVKRKNDASASAVAERLILALFEDVCDLIEDLRGDYGESSESELWREFLEDTFTDLVSAISVWAAEADRPELAERAQTGVKVIAETIEGLD